MHRPVQLSFARGRLVVDGWPPQLPLPYGLDPRPSGRADGAARLRRNVRRLLQAERVPFRDAAAPPSMRVPEPESVPPGLVELFAAWSVGGQGAAIGLPLEHRALLVHLAVAVCSAPALVVVPDTGAVAAWLRALQPQLGDSVHHRAARRSAAVTVVTAAAAAWDIGWLGGRHELLVLDGMDLVPASRLWACADGAVALLRLGFANVPLRLEHTAGIGGVLGVAGPSAARQTLELRLPLDADERARYEAAWHEFFAAFDRFAALRPAAGFGEFVRWARGDAAARPGLLAWHRSVRIAGWTAAKQQAVARLLQRHRERRVVVFTGDCESAYAIARAELVPAVTSALPASERAGYLAAFTAGRMRAVVGPRLLETGLGDGAADVAIVTGPCRGAAQRAARWTRVAAHGVVYELLSQETMEVGRAARQRGAAAAAAAAVDL